MGQCIRSTTARSAQTAKRCYDTDARKGYRCLAVAWREFPRDATVRSPTTSASLVFVGFCVFVDPPKATAAAAIARLEARRRPRQDHFGRRTRRSCAISSRR